MSHALFFVSATNPNDNTGGGGCVCSPMKQVDCRPPYVVFPGNDMENISSPNVVACASCISAAADALLGEVLASGEGIEIMSDPSRTVELPIVEVQAWDDDDIPEV